jgi:hypothetical protein
MNSSIAAPLFRKPRRVARFEHGDGLTPAEYMRLYRPDLARRARTRQTLVGLA